MTPEQHAIWQHTYATTLGILAHRCGALIDAVAEAAKAADHAVSLYPGETKRGPGRPPKEDKQ